MPRKNRPPSYRLHKARNCAVVTINGKNHYMGAYGSSESHEEYARLIAEWQLIQLNGQKTSPKTCSHITLNELILAFWQHVKEKYVKNGQPTSERRSFKTALKPVRELYGRKIVSEFGPLALIACRQQLVKAGICRKRVNGHVTRIRQMFKWGVSRELVAVEVWQALQSVEGLKKGEGIETAPIKPVTQEHIDAIKDYVTPQIWAIVQLQLWTGCRPGEACAIRTMDLRMTGDVWEYRPESHKTEHHGKERIIYLGPKA